jgi:hypothetical protein
VVAVSLQAGGNKVRVSCKLHLGLSYHLVAEIAEVLRRAQIHIAILW